MSLIAIVDSGPLLAVANSADPDHEGCLALLEDTRHHLVIPALCVAEVSFILGTRHGPGVEAMFLRGLQDFDVRGPSREEWPRISELVAEYADFPLGGTDASVVSLAETVETELIITLDKRHFSAVRPRHCTSFTLTP